MQERDVIYLVKHIVFWNFNEEAHRVGTEALGAEIKAKFATLAGQVPGLLHIEFGLNYKEGGHDAALYCELENRAAEALYQSHPAHLAVKAFVHQYFCNRACADYDA